MRRLLLSSYLSMVAIAVMVNVPPTCLTSIKESFALSETQGGLLLSSLFWGFSLTIILTGPLADRYNMKLFFILASFLQISGLLISSFAPIFQIMFIGAFLMGMGSGILEVLVNPLVCLLIPENKTKAMNFCHAFYSIGAVFSVIFASLLLKIGFSWRRVYLFGIVPSLIFGLGYVKSSLPKLPQSDYKRFFGFELIKQPVFFMFLLSMLLAGGTELGSAQWIPAYLEESLNFSRFGGAFGLVLFSTAMALGRITMSKISSKTDSINLLNGASFFCIILFILSSLLKNNFSVMSSFFLLGFFVSIFWPTVIAYSSDVFPKGGATMYSFLAAAGNAGGMIFPALVGIIADRWSLSRGIGTISFLPLLLILVFSVIKRKTQSSF